MSSKTKSKKFIYKEGITKKHEVLKEAMKYLAKDSHEYLQPGKHEYICWCIGQVVNPENYEYAQHDLKDEIHTRLKGCTSLEIWLVNYKGLTYGEISKDYYKNKAKKLQNTRKLWMQSMYEEFLAKDE